MDPHETIRAYYEAFRTRDREALRALLTPDFHHVSAFGEWRDRDRMLEAIWSAVGQCWAVNLEVFGRAPTFMVRYEHACRTDAPIQGGARARMAEFIRFEGERIAEIEVYTGRAAAAEPS